MKNAELRTLYRRIDRCGFCKAEKNELQHIHGFGAMNPKLMLVLINPTHRNLSSDPKYRGDRFPFIGVRQFWNVLARGGLVDREIEFHLPPRARWSDEHTQYIKNELIRNKLFLTNIVKCCYNHSAYPDQKVIEHQLSVLAQEIRIVNPKKIITFGGLVYKTLTSKNITLADYWSGPHKKEKEIISGLGITLVPCYFPIGRGKPKKAAEILRKFA